MIQTRLEHDGNPGDAYFVGIEALEFHTRAQAVLFDLLLDQIETYGVVWARQYHAQNQYKVATTLARLRANCTTIFDALEEMGVDPHLADENRIQQIVQRVLAVVPFHNTKKSAKKTKMITE